LSLNQEIAETEESSMQIFADGANSFHLFDWMAWEMACLHEERIIPPKEFKMFSKLQKRHYLKLFKECGHA
jgi:hypothetical protein